MAFAVDPLDDFDRGPLDHAGPPVDHSLDRPAAYGPDRERQCRSFGETAYGLGRCANDEGDHLRGGHWYPLGA